MKLQDQVCSLELAKKLKKLGVKQESIFYWCKFLKPTSTAWDIRGNKWKDDCISSQRQLQYISAFTVAELGEMLPRGYRTIRKSKRSDTDYVWSTFDTTGMGVMETISTIEANARAKMLIYLIENKLIRVKA